MQNVAEMAGGVLALPSPAGRQSRLPRPTAASAAPRAAPDPRAAADPRSAASGLSGFVRDQEIFCEGDPAEWFYEVVSGAVRSYKLLGDGRRQIDAFHLAGDIFGIEPGQRHRFSAEAIGSVSLRLFRRRSLETLTACDSILACRLVEGMARALERAQDHMLLLGRKCAREKLASFLLGLARRAGNAKIIDLPMSRTDIADHLGLTIETVSRMLTQLQRAHVIEFAEGRRLVALCNPAALRQLDMGHEAALRPHRLEPRALPRPPRSH